MQLWEVLKDGKNGEIFEVTECSVRDYIGTKIKVSESSDYKGDYKTIVKADANLADKDAKSIVTIYGCLGTAEYKKVETYKLLPTFKEVIDYISSWRTVYVKDEGEYKQISRYTSFDDIDVDDLADLMSKSYYVKELN